LLLVVIYQRKDHQADKVEHKGELDKRDATLKEIAGHFLTATRDLADRNEAALEKIVDTHSQDSHQVRTAIDRLAQRTAEHGRLVLAPHAEADYDSDAISDLAKSVGVSASDLDHAIQGIRKRKRGRG